MSCHLQARKMDHRVETVGSEKLAQGAAITNIELRKPRPPANAPRDALEHRGLAVAEVVDDEDFMARRHQLDHGVGTDVTRAAADEN